MTSTLVDLVFTRGPSVAAALLLLAGLLLVQGLFLVVDRGKHPGQGATTLEIMGAPFVAAVAAAVLVGPSPSLERFLRWTITPVIAVLIFDILLNYAMRWVWPPGTIPGLSRRQLWQLNGLFVLIVPALIGMLVLLAEVARSTS